MLRKGDVFQTLSPPILEMDQAVLISFKFGLKFFSCNFKLISKIDQSILVIELISQQWFCNLFKTFVMYSMNVSDQPTSLAVFESTGLKKVINVHDTVTFTLL